MGITCWLNLDNGGGLGSTRCRMQSVLTLGSSGESVCMPIANAPKPVFLVLLYS